MAMARACTDVFFISRNLKVFYVCRCVHHCINHIKIQQDPTVYQNFISDLYEAQHVSGDTPLIIRSLKCPKQPLVLRKWKVVGRVVAGRCQAEPNNVQQLHVQQPSTYAKAEAARVF
jgi:hypothetical protein